MNLSVPPTKLYACTTAPRVSASHPTSRICYSVKSGGGSAGRRSRCSCLHFCDTNLWGTGKILYEKKSSSSRAAAAAAAVASSSTSDQYEISPPRTFLDARTELGFFSLHN
ncbi:hypothetical protein CDL12_30117 [Handroanthus impetiginosus]|uniref:Uncharacterized protein n=1 Tax=Handroanthus impetiginosus TaxID=429701 RepID=A0A2G9FWI9_9LAMI|nr:hypothetical protein CDL12_30117 [Handroanthus impetiginosus]